MQSAKYMRHHVYVVIMLVLSICATCLTGCSANLHTDNSEEIMEYVVNKRTGKIHDPDCPSVGQMSEKNKLFVSDTLLSLLKQDYIICRRCRAGVQKSRMDETWNRLLHKNLYGDDIEITASYEDYLTAIDEMSEWYVDHVPTYASYIQEEDFSKYNGDDKSYKEYILKNKRKSKTYKVLSSDADAADISSLKSNDRILRGSENAALNYLEHYNQIDFERKIAYYPCDILTASPDYNMPGDDCVRYLFAVFNRMDPQFTRKYATLTRSSYSRTDSSTMASDSRDVVYGFINLGFKIYDSTPQKICVDNDNNVEGYIFEIADDFKLQKGDILARMGHVHIYLGDGISVEAANFGWGRVYRSYPQTYIIKKDAHNGLNCISLTNSSGDEEYYTHVYRYHGTKEGGK